MERESSPQECVELTPLEEEALQVGLESEKSGKYYTIDEVLDRAKAQWKKAKTDRSA